MLLQLLADSFAANGIKVVVPNLFRDPVQESDLDSGSFDFKPWLARNGFDYSEPRVRKVIAALKAEGVKLFAATGYCYGARSAFNLAFENKFNVVAVSHPSLLNVPEDLQVRCSLQSLA